MLAARNAMAPARLDGVQTTNVCMKCHSQGQPLANPYQRQIMRLAGRLRSRQGSEGLLETGASQARRAILHAFRRRYRTRTACRAMTSCRAPSTETASVARVAAMCLECASCTCRYRTDHCRLNVRSRTFRFVTPAETSSLKGPNARNGCHADKITQWPADALKTWTNSSPWRVAS
jgi:hypothetical protein